MHWKNHEIEQLNGCAARIKSSAEIQVITETWDMGAVAYPYMVYMPEKNRLLMLLFWYEQERVRKFGTLTSDDHGATWTRPQCLGDGWGVDLTYLGNGTVVFEVIPHVEREIDSDRGENKYWFSHDYGESWDDSTLAPGCEDGMPFHEDSPFLVDSDPATGKVTRLWAAGKSSQQACLLRTSDDMGRTWSGCRHIPQWGQTGEIVLHRAANGNMIAAYRVNLPQFKGDIDHNSGLGVSVSKDNGETWSDFNVLYAWGRHMSSMVNLDNGDVVLTYVVRRGYVDADDGYPQFGIEAIVSHDHGQTWDLDHKYMLAVWKGNRKGPDAWYASPQRTATMLLPDRSLVTAFGTGYRSQGLHRGFQNIPTHSPQDIAIVRWRVHEDQPLNVDATIADAPMDSDLRNVFDPQVAPQVTAYAIGG